MPSKQCRLLALLIYIAATLQGCGERDTAVQPLTGPSIFRVNLDNMPRILVCALDDELWAAYDVEHSRLYKTWKGGINFNGPMYDDRHNVQPSTQGVAYSVDTSRRSPWQLYLDGQQLPAKVEYLGYSIKGNRATIAYKVPLKDRDDIIISETPVFSQTEDRTPVLTRIFETSGIPDGVRLMLHTTQGALAAADGLVVSGGSFKKISTKKNLGNGYDIEGDITLINNGETRVTARYVRLSMNEEAGPVGSNKVSDNESQSAATIEDGKRLIGLNDCAACHSMAKKGIGPSFEMIAAKYRLTDDIIQTLSAKIIKGGSGVWGRQVMTPHPGLSTAHASAMVAYILSIDSASSAGSENYRNGLVADFYKPGIQLSGIPEFIPGQKPNLSVVVPDIEFVGVDMSINRVRNDFFGFDDQFVMYLSGFLNVDKAGMYQLRLKANAGAKLFLNDEKIADVNYSNYDYHEQEVSAHLNKGPNRIRVSYYEDIYSSNLSLRWRQPGQKKFEKIPANLFTHDPSMIKATADGIKEVYEVNAPGFGSPVDGVHPSFDVATVRPEDFNMRLSDLEFLPDGSLAVATWDSTGSIYILEGVQGSDRSKIKARLFAKGLYEVMGLEYVDGSLYALQKWELTELNDTDGDGVADVYSAVLDDWTATANFHEWAFGLLYRDGFFYFNTGIGLGGNGIVTDTGINYIPRVQTRDRGKTIKVNKNNWTFEAIAHGYKAPNGIGFGVDGEIFTTDNEGHMVPTNKLMHVPPTGYPFFGNDEVLQQLSLPVPPMKPPVLWMPETELSNSPSQPVYFDKGPYNEGQMVFGDVHHGGLHRVYVEKVNDEYQGAIFRFTQGLEAGINRLAWGPDSSLYMAGLGAGGDFGHHGQCCGLQRLMYNGKSTLDILKVSARANGMEIEFTEPLRIGDGVLASDYSVQQFWYETADDVPEGGVKNDIENLRITSVVQSGDKKKVFIGLDGMKKEHVIYIKMNKPFISDAGNRLWTGEAWYTLNNFPKQTGREGVTKVKRDNQLLEEETEVGWELLFDGKSMDSWQVTGDCKVRSGAIHLKDKGSMLVSDKSYKNFEWEFEWKSEQRGDAGVYFHLPDTISFSHLSAGYPEMQIIDEQDNPTHLTGALFNLEAPRYKIAKPHEFNHSRVIVKDGHVEYWLNGFRVTEFDYNGNGWAKKWRDVFGNAPHIIGQGKISIAIQNSAISVKNMRIRNL